MLKKNKISILIPVYNEERTLKKVIDLIKTVKIPNFEKEIIVVDDASTDNTSNIIKELKIQDGKLKFFRHPKNMGKGAALRTAIKNTTGDLAIIQDADLEYDPKEIANLVYFLNKGKYDVVYGSRKLKKENKSSYVSYYLGNAFLNMLTNFLYKSNLTDMETCYKLIPSKILKEINLVANRFNIEPEITAKILKKRYKIGEIPISYCPRKLEEGKKIGWRDGISAIWTLFYWRFKKI